MSTTVDTELGWIPDYTHEDAPRRDEADRYAVYRLGKYEHEPSRVCETSETGVVSAIKQMMADTEIRRGDKVGVLDRLTRQWVVNPFVS